MNNDLYGGRYDPGSAAVAVLATSHDHDPGALAKRGIALRDDGQLNESEAIFVRLTEIYPNLVFGWQELGVLYRRQKRMQESEVNFLRAKQIAPHDINTCRHLSFFYATCGRLAEALDEWKRVAQDSDKSTEIYREFLKYVAVHSESEILALLELCETPERFVRHDAVCDWIKQVLADGAPFSLIRLGDGEGAWLGMSEADESENATLYESNRREMLNVWFSEDRAYERLGFRSLSTRLRAVLKRASLIGIPDKRRVVHEYNFSSVRGIPSIGNIFRALVVKDEMPADFIEVPLYCTNDIHLDFHINGHFEELLRGNYKVGVISGHVDLAERLVSSWKTKVTYQIIIPEEKSFSQVQGVSGIERAHYPAYFYRTLREIRHSAFSAQLWLVAAGFLGKFYCEQLRQAGVVALDIGSVADGWMGKVTRPTLRRIDQYMLREMDVG